MPDRFNGGTVSDSTVRTCVSQPAADAVDGPLLRVGVLIDSSVQPRWVRRVLEEIQSSRIAKVVLVVRRAASSQPPRSRYRWVSWLYFRLDEWLFRPAVNAFELVGIDDLTHDAASIEVQPDERQGSDHFSEADINAILRYQLDVALYFGSHVLGGGRCTSRAMAYGRIAMRTRW